jgi:hypothetical protein
MIHPRRPMAPIEALAQKYAQVRVGNPAQSMKRLCSSLALFLWVLHGKPDPTPYPALSQGPSQSSPIQDLTGVVCCQVAAGTACFSFAVPSVELRLNGFTITGKGNATTSCGGAVTAGEIGVSTNGIYITAAVGQNFVRDNTVVGNPPIQVAARGPS